MVGRVNLYTDEFNTLIENRSHRALWYRSAVCSCVSRDSGQPDFLCPICHGSGYRYLAPKEINLAVTSMSGRIELKTLETREPGTAYVTPKSDIIMGYRDRLVFPDFKCVFSEVLHFNERVDGRGISPKTYRNMKEVISLCCNQYEYENDVDFKISEDRFHLIWLNKDFIPKLDGKNMSILYYTTPSYFVVDLLHELRATQTDQKREKVEFVELPKQYQIQREDFIYGVKSPEPVSNKEDTTVGQPSETKSSWDSDSITV